MTQKSAVRLVWALSIMMVPMIVVLAYLLYERSNTQWVIDVKGTAFHTYANSLEGRLAEMQDAYDEMNESLVTRGDDAT